MYQALGVGVALIFCVLVWVNIPHCWNNYIVRLGLCMIGIGIKNFYLPKNDSMYPGS